MIVEITVVPKSGRFSVSRKNGKIKILLKSAPEQNKANIELIKELSKALKAEVHIISGQKSRNKKLEIAVTKEKWEQFLSNSLK